MAPNSQIPNLIIFFLILVPSSSSHNHQTTLLNISSSLFLTQQILSLTSHGRHETKTLQLSNNNTLSFPLHSRSSLPSRNYIPRNYTSLTLTRLARDQSRVNSILSKQQQQWPVISGYSRGSGEYFARVGFGQPARAYYMVIDTGSDVTWLQCSPCVDCYRQSDPIYNPAGSSTYKTVACNAPQCNSLKVSTCRNNNCLYEVSYGDGSYTVGDFATETVTFGGGGSVAGIAFGCGHDNEGLFTGAAGLLGMGDGDLSLPSQIRATSFSYCLVNRDSSAQSTLEFNSVNSDDSVVAPLLKNARTDTYWYVDLTGINVGGRPVDISADLFAIGSDGRGGVIVDSGTAVTRLRDEVYGAVRDAFRRGGRNLPLAGGFSLFDTCYDFSAMRTVEVPTVSFQFAGGKTLMLPASNYLIPVSGDGKFCFAFAPTSDSLSIIGNVQQQGTRVSYNLASNNIAFSPNKC